MSGTVKMTLIGIFMLLLGGFTAWLAIRKKIKCTEEIEAEITDIKRTRVKSGKGNRRNDYSPVLKYKVGSEECGGVADISSIMPNKFKVGETMTVKYDPNDPNTFCVKGKAGTLGWSIVLLLFGIAFIVSAFVF